MPSYVITAPDGRKFKVTAPDGATKENALEYFRSKFQQKQKPSSLDPSEYNSESPEYQAKYGPTAGMSKGEKLFANLGAGINLAWIGGKQLIGAASGEDSRNAAELNKPIAKSMLGGGVTQFVGAALPSVPAMFIPGVNTVAGGALFGAGVGLTSPTENDNVFVGKAINTGVGAATGGLGAKYIPVATQAIGKAGKSLVNSTTNALARNGLLPRAATERVLQNQANNAFINAVGDPRNALSKIAAHRDVPGTKPTTSQILGDTESLALERQLRESSGEASIALSNSRTTSNKARYEYLREELDKNPDVLWDAAKEFASKSKASMRLSSIKGIDPGGSIYRKIGRLRNATDNKRAVDMLQNLQNRYKDALARKGTEQIDSLHKFRMVELDDALESLSKTDSKLAALLSKDIQSIKVALDKKMSQGIAGNEWQNFLQGYADRARNATQAEAGRELLTKLDKLTPDSTGTPALVAGRRTLRNADQTVDKYGNPIFSPLANDAIKTVNQSLDVESRAIAPNIRTANSATAANLNFQRDMQKLLRPVMEAPKQASNQPMINSAAAGIGVIGGPAAAAATLATGAATNAIKSRTDQIALSLARKLFDAYRDPQIAVKVLQQRIKAGTISPTVGGRALELIASQSGVLSGEAAMISTRAADSALAQ